MQYRRRNAQHWTLLLFLWLLVAPLILYLVTALLLPTSQDDVVVTDWREDYYANNRKVFALFGLTFVMDLVDTLLKDLGYFSVARSAYYGPKIAVMTKRGCAGSRSSSRLRPDKAGRLSTRPPPGA